MMLFSLIRSGTLILHLSSYIHPKQHLIIPIKHIFLITSWAAVRRQSILRREYMLQACLKISEGYPVERMELPILVAMNIKSKAILTNKTAICQKGFCISKLFCIFIELHNI